ncbi:MAG: tetratricopeptide repeat protein [Bacteroidales bacterium]|nr:tetratricopeptide repeat protein [Bacteroidales bacterium]MCF8338020.1 tetratricopeptide repeat protein [Bacteroidales bacterium]
MKQLKIIGLILAVAMLSGCGLNRMVKNYENVDYSVTPEVLENKGGTVELEIQGYVPEKYFHKKAVVEVQPVLKHEDGEKELETFKLKGEKAEDEGKVISKKEGGSFTYETSFEYKPEMKNSTLVVTPVASLRDNSEELGTTELAEGIIITSTRIKHSEKVAMAPHKYEKETIVSEDANIYFAQNFSNLNWQLDLNQKNNTKESLKELQDFVLRGWKIKNIELNAWASPEGEVDFNEDLAVDRAETGENYITKKLNNISGDKDSKVNFESAEDIKIKTQARGEDWNGFMEAVEESDLEKKNTILNVVRSQPDLKKREQEIRNMAMVYEEVAEKILPPLRRVEFTINSYEPKFSDSQMKDLVFSNPDTLEVNEMLYTATLFKDNNKKLDIYQTIINNYPKCWRAHNNKAAVHLLEGNLDKAEASIEEAKGTDIPGEVYNNMGVLASKKGDFDKAIQLFEKAKKEGIGTSYNIGIAHIVKGQFDKAKSLMEGAVSCDYNLGLVQLMLENYDNAEQTLKCAEKDAATHYLLAVAGARQDNKEMVINHLEKAVELESALKAQAAEDAEFIDYYSDSKFKEIVK